MTGRARVQVYMYTWLLLAAAASSASMVVMPMHSANTTIDAAMHTQALLPFLWK